MIASVGHLLLDDSLLLRALAFLVLLLIDLSRILVRLFWESWLVGLDLKWLGTRIELPSWHEVLRHVRLGPMTGRHDVVRDVEVATFLRLRLLLPSKSIRIGFSCPLLHLISLLLQKTLDHVVLIDLLLLATAVIELPPLGTATDERLDQDAGAALLALLG